MKIGVALITESPFFEEIVKIENEVHDICGFLNKLEVYNNIPHTTLFQGTFRDDTDYEFILHKLKNYYMENVQEKSLYFEKMMYIPEGWYFYTCKKTTELQLLHNITLELCKKDIVLEPDRMTRDVFNLPQNQIEAIEKYGYRYSEDAFFPHITIGRSYSENREEIISLLETKVANFPKNIKIERLTIYKMGMNGIHEKTLAEVKLT